jgi:hypothetical protein
MTVGNEQNQQKHNYENQSNNHQLAGAEDGVALAAIQGLNEKLKEKDAQIKALEKRLADLEQLVKTSAQK